MKALPFKIPKPQNTALVYQIDEGKSFYNQLHQHEEIQISYIESGEGKLIVGDTIGQFKASDLLVIGSNLPHLFQADDKEQNCKMFTLFFSKTSFGNLFELEETRSVSAFFRKSMKGIRLIHPNKEIIGLLKEAEKTDAFEKMIALFRIILLIEKNESEPLSTYIYDKHYTEDEGNRMNQVMNFTMENFGREISLDEIAEIAHMTPNAFCRYFKKRTNKTYFQFLIEVRLENACKLLQQQKDLSVAEISDQSGFRNIAFFNRKFKSYKCTTPTKFREVVKL
ncbi:MAG: helix-turn-helix domain-containing protein [Crocinitomicaceae bacterium]|nr:helix-turn-helix domain-containing protein [Crocinitomicaceae bacterium]